MLKKQKESGRLQSPSEIIRELGKGVDDENSILYWATKNNIPIFCPAITDGAFGLQLHFFKQENPDFGIDVTADMKDLADLVLNSEKTGGIILGGGVAKHHTIGANILRDGLDYAVYVSTATEADGSLSGAKVKEAVSWGKVSETADNVYVEGDATINCCRGSCNRQDRYCWALSWPGCDDTASASPGDFRHQYDSPCYLHCGLYFRRSYQ